MLRPEQRKDDPFGRADWQRLHRRCRVRRPSHRTRNLGRFSRKRHGAAQAVSGVVGKASEGPDFAAGIETSRKARPIEAALWLVDHTQ